MHISSVLTALSGFIPDFLKREDITQKFGQQLVGGIFPNLVDETLLMALMNAVRTTSPEGENRYRVLVAFHKELDPKQRNRLRNILGSLVLTEKFDPDHVMERTIKKDGETVEKFSRVQIDYEYTAEDPRVQFLANLANDLLDPTRGATTEERNEAVKKELLALDFILKRTPVETIRRWAAVYAKRKVPRYVGKTLDKALDTPYWSLVKYRLSWEEKALAGGVIHIDRYRELLERWLAAHPGETESEARKNDTFHEDCLSAIRVRAGWQERELEAAKKMFLPKWARLPIVIGVIVIAISAIITSII